MTADPAAAPPRRLLHLIRRGATPPAGAVAATDLVVYSDGDRWHLDRPDGALVDDARLHDLVFAADSAIVW